MRIRHSAFVVFLFLLVSRLQAEEATLEQIKAAAATQSKYLSTQTHPASNEPLKADQEEFSSEIAPILANSCVQCHGPEKQKGKFRVDTLDPTCFTARMLTGGWM